MKSVLLSFHPISYQRPVVPVEPSCIIKSENKNNDLDLARNLKRLWNMKGIVIPIVAGALGTVSKGLEKKLKELDIRGKIDTI